jgi:hypothetical protein
LAFTPPVQIQIQSTAQVGTNGIKCLIYGLSGAGKTFLLSTAPRVLILSAESGLLSLSRFNLPYILIKSLADLQAAYNYVATNPDSRQFWTIALDSISEIAEQVLAYEMANNRDPRKAYGEMATQIMQVMRLFRDLPQRHVVFIAKQGRITDASTGGVLWGPLMPGQQLDQQMPYMFDEVFQLVVGKTTEGQSFRALRTERDNQNEAKDRSGKLAPWEPANLDTIFNKIMAA